MTTHVREPSGAVPTPSLAQRLGKWWLRTTGQLLRLLFLLLVSLIRFALRLVGRALVVMMTFLPLILFALFVVLFLDGSISASEGDVIGLAIFFMLAGAVQWEILRGEVWAFLRSFREDRRA